MQTHDQEQFGRQLGDGLRTAFGLAAVIGIAGWLWSSYMHARHAPTANSPTLTTLPIQKLATVPNNVPVHIDADTLLKLAKGDVTPENVSVDTRPASDNGALAATMFNNEWTLTKSKGELLVSGWTTVEFALNMSNNSPGALFSARPGWLAANTLVPVQVPVYRLEQQDTARYLPDGKITDRASASVMMLVSVADTAKAVGDLVRDAILQHDGSLPADDQFFGAPQADRSYAYANLTDGVVHLTGQAATADAKKVAGEAAADAIKRLHLSYPVSNDLNILPKNQ